MRLLYHCLLSALTAASLMPVPLRAQDTLRVMTFNVRYDNSSDGPDNWHYRRDAAAAVVRDDRVDVLGTQEVLHNQRSDMQERLPGYEVIGVGREDGKEKGEYSALWFRRDRFYLVDSGWFWLSETPEVAGSKGWDGACERIATWAKLRDRVSEKEFFVLNTHLDHIGQEARRKGVELILERTATLADSLPVVITGDFNATPESDVVTGMTNPENAVGLTDTRRTAAVVSGPEWTFHDFGQLAENERPRLDYIFVNTGFAAASCAVLPEKRNGRFISDHAPVLATLLFR